MKITSNRRKSATATALIILAALPITRTAHAQSDAVTKRVSTWGLELADPIDQALLRERLVKAARRVCLRAGDIDLTYNIDFRDCQNEAFRNAWREVEVRIAAAQSASVVASAAEK